MTGFLDHLARQALGTPAPGAARLSLLPHFATPQASDPGLVDAAAAVPLATGPTAPAASPPGPLAAVAHADAPDAPAPITMRPAPAPQSEGPVTARHAPSEPRQPVAAHQRTPRPSAPQAATPSQPPPDHRITIHPGHWSDTAAPAAPGEPRPAPVTLPARAAAPPLGDDVIRSRTVTDREERVVLNVAIDRIEVRAAAPQKQAPARPRPRPQPEVSLADYLRGGPGRTS